MNPSEVMEVCAALEEWFWSQEIKSPKDRTKILTFMLAHIVLRKRNPGVSLEEGLLAFDLNLRLAAQVLGTIDKITEKEDRKK